ncbi:MAG: hypothetical protein ACHQJ6_06075 [Candidatus Berkiellales bacterium]
MTNELHLTENGAKLLAKIVKDVPKPNLTGNPIPVNPTPDTGWWWTPFKHISDLLSSINATLEGWGQYMQGWGDFLTKLWNQPFDTTIRSIPLIGALYGIAAAIAGFMAANPFFAGLMIAFIVFPIVMFLFMGSRNSNNISITNIVNPKDTDLTKENSAKQGAKPAPGATAEHQLTTVVNPKKRKPKPDGIQVENKTVFATVCNIDKETGDWKCETNFATTDVIKAKASRPETFTPIHDDLKKKQMEIGARHQAYHGRKGKHPHTHAPGKQAQTSVKIEDVTHAPSELAPPTVPLLALTPLKEVSEAEERSALPGLHPVAANTASVANKELIALQSDRQLARMR